jgi:tetratricopeptide (TPR) repeat protein
MLSKSFRAAAAAFVLGTAAVAVGTLSMTVPAEAAARAAVGRYLQEAIRQAGAGNLSAARASVGAAEGVGGLTAGDRAAIDQVKQYISQKAGSAGGGGCAGLYLKGDYRGVIALHARDAQCMTLTAQAYYLTRDFTGCTRYIRDNFGSGAGENTLVMQQRCAYESQDNEGQRQALELLVSRTNKPAYWSQLLDTAAGTKGLSDHGTLDIYRLKLMTGSLTKPEDYSLLAQLALQLGFAAESVSVIQKATDAKVQMGGRTGALLTMAKGQAGANAAAAPRITAAGNGDALVKLGEDAWGQGRFPDALKLIQAGIQKGVSDADNAQIRLGMAYLGAGQKDQAIRAFDHANTDPKQKVIAHLWSIYARTH